MAATTTQSPSAARITRRRRLVLSAAAAGMGLVVDVRQTNIVRLVGQAKRRNWHVEPAEWLEALEAALTEDRQAIEPHVAGDDAGAAGNYGRKLPARPRPLLSLAGSGHQTELLGSADRGATVVHSKLAEDVLRVRPHGAQ
jgi:phytoene/squalene synthetase